MIFLIILTIGFLYEWYHGALEIVIWIVLYIFEFARCDPLRVYMDQQGGPLIRYGYGPKPIGFLRIYVI